MVPSRFPRLTSHRAGRLAVFLSLSLHGLVILLFWFVPNGANRGPCCTFEILDTRVSAPSVEIYFDVQKPPRPPTQAKLKQAAAEPVQPLADPKVVSPSIPVPPVTPDPVSAATVPTVPSKVSAAESIPGAQATGSGGHGPTVTFFQIPARCRSVVYVIDRSASMGLNGSLGVARRELLASLEQLSEETRFQVIAYNRVAEPLSLSGRTDLVPATSENKRQAAQILEALWAEGSTDHLPALKRALALQPDVIYFLTDADDLKDQQVRALTLLNRGRTAIHTIELNMANRHREDLPLHVLARDNGGTYQAVSMQDPEFSVRNERP